MAVTDELRRACAAVARRARHVHIDQAAIPAYAAALPLDVPPSADPDTELSDGPEEQRAAFWLTLDAINFGSGWFPTLRKPPRRSGYFTIASGVRQRFGTRGPWSAAELEQIDALELASVLGQDPGHELIELFCHSLRDLGRRVGGEFGGSYLAVVAGAGGSAITLVDRLSSWSCFSDVSSYEELSLPFLKRAQIAAADLARAGFEFTDLERLTMFADNLVPHVLRLDGILRFAPELAARIGREEPLEHGSAEEVEIRACALHAVELIVAARPATRAMDVDALLWRRGQQPPYKEVPRHRARCTAY